MFATILSLILAGTVTFSVNGTSGKTIRVGGLGNYDSIPASVDWGDGTTSQVAPSGSVYHAYSSDVGSIVICDVDYIGVGKYAGTVGGQAVTNFSSFSDLSYDSIWRAEVDYTLVGVTLSGVTEVGRNAFVHCRAMLDFSADESLEKLGSCALACTRLGKIVLPRSIRCIGARNAASWRQCLTNVTLEADNDVFYCVGNSIVHRGDNIVVLCVSQTPGFTNYLDGAVGGGECLDGTYITCLGHLPDKPEPGWAPETLEIRSWEGDGSVKFAMHQTGYLQWPQDWTEY